MGLKDLGMEDKEGDLGMGKAKMEEKGKKGMVEMEAKMV